MPLGAGPFPAVLNRTPYDERAEWNMLERMAPAFTERGYALIVQDTRGKNGSKGQLFAFTAEARDGYDTIAWLAERPWCDGQIAMWGDSYCGFTQWAAASAGPPALKAVAPMNICDGAARVGTADGAAAACVELGEVGYRVLRGHRPQLQVCSSDYPRYLPHPGTDEDPWDAVSGVAGEQRLQLGGASGARLVLTALAMRAGEEPAAVAASSEES